MRTLQEMFEIGVKGIFNQGGKCLTPGDTGCCYFNDNRRCFVGWLLPDGCNNPIWLSEHNTDEYDEVLDDLERAGNLPASQIVYEEYDEFGDYCVLTVGDFYSACQDVHDQIDPENWKVHFIDVAKDFNLSSDFIRELPDLE